MTEITFQQLADVAPEGTIISEGDRLFISMSALTGKPIDKSNQ
jgi:hypothetical protein